MTKKTKVTQKVLTTLAVGGVITTSTLAPNLANAKMTRIDDTKLPDVIKKGEIKQIKELKTPASIKVKDANAIDPDNALDFPSENDYYHIFTNEMRFGDSIVWCVNPFRMSPTKTKYGDFSSDMKLAMDKRVNDKTYMLMNYWWAHGGTQNANADMNADGKQDDTDHVIMQYLMWLNNDLGSNMTLPIDKLVWTNDDYGNHVKYWVHELNRQLNSGEWNAEYGQTQNDASATLNMVNHIREDDGSNVYTLNASISEGYQNRMREAKVNVEGIEGASILQDGKEVQDGKIDVNKEFQVKIPKVSEDTEWKITFSGTYLKNDSVDYIADMKKVQNVVVFSEPAEKHVSTELGMKSDKPVEADIHKTIVDNAQDVEHENLNKENNIVTYKLESIIPNDVPLKHLAISDDLEDVLDLNNESKIGIYVSDLDKESNENQDSQEEQLTNGKPEEAKNREIATSPVENSDETKSSSDKVEESSTPKEESSSSSKADKELEEAKIDGEDVTDKGEIKIEGNKVTWIANDPSEFEGKKLTMILQANIKEGADLTPYLENGQILIPNVFHLSLNDYDLISNEVNVTPEIENPVPTEDTPQKPVITPTPSSKQPELVQPKPETPQVTKQQLPRELPQTGTDKMKMVGIVSSVVGAVSLVAITGYNFISRKKNKD